MIADREPDDERRGAPLSGLRWDGSAFPMWAWALTAVLCLVVPPAGVFLLGFGVVYSLRLGGGE